MAVIEGSDPPMVDAILVGDESEVYVSGSTTAALAESIPTAVAIGSRFEPSATSTNSITAQGRWVAPSARTYQGDSFVATTTYYLPVSQENEGVLPQPNLGRYPCRIQCPYCHQDSLTKTRDRIDSCTICMTIALFFLFWPLFWLPLVCSSCKTTEHHCEHCDLVVGESPDHCQCCR